MSSTWTTDSICQEINDVAALIQARASASPAAADAIAEPMIKSVVLKIQALGRSSMRAGSAMSLYQTVQGSSLPANLKDMTTKAIDALLVADASAPQSALTLTVATQKLVTPWNYCSQQDANKLASAEYWESIAVVVARLKACGVCSMHEDTKRWWVSLLLHFYLAKNTGKMPPYLWVYNLGQDLYASFHSSTVQVAAGISPLKAYPTSPAELGPDWVRLVYGDAAESQPVVLDGMAGLSNLAKNHVPVRSTSSLLSDADRLTLRTNNASGKTSKSSASMHLLEALAASLTQRVRADDDVRHAIGDRPRPMLALRDAEPPVRPIAATTSGAPAGPVSPEPKLRVPLTPSLPSTPVPADPGKLSPMDLTSPEHEELSLETADCDSLAAFEAAAFATLSNQKRRSSIMRRPAAATSVAPAPSATGC